MRKINFFGFSLTISVVYILSFLVNVSGSRKLVYNTMQCEDYCFRDPNCTNYGTGPMDASRKMECIVNPLTGTMVKLQARNVLHEMIKIFAFSKEERLFNLMGILCFVLVLIIFLGIYNQNFLPLHSFPLANPHAVETTLKKSSFAVVLTWQCRLTSQILNTDGEFTG